jgi:hypothetical protein
MKRFIILLAILLCAPALHADVNYLVKSTPHATVIPAKHLLSELGDSIGGSVSRLALTRAVVNREPVDIINNVTSLQHIYFFTELKGLMGERIFHRWMFNGKVVKETEFEVGGPRWRVWSSTTLLPELLGEWKVYVVDVTGRVLREAIFNYSPF